MAGAQLLDRPVRVDDGQAEHVGERALADRKLEGGTVDASDDLQPQIELAQEVREAALRLAAAEAEDPVALDGGVDRDHRGHDAGEMRMPLGDVPQDGMIDECDAAVGQGHDGVIHDPQVEAVEVDEVAGHVQRGDLAFAAFQRQRAGRDAIEQKAAVLRLGAVLDDFRFGGDFADPPVDGPRARTISASDRWSRSVSVETSAPISLFSIILSLPRTSCFGSGYPSVPAEPHPSRERAATTTRILYGFPGGTINGSLHLSGNGDVHAPFLFQASVSRGGCRSRRGGTARFGRGPTGGAPGLQRPDPRDRRLREAAGELRDRGDRRGRGAGFRPSPDGGELHSSSSFRAVPPRKPAISAMAA